MVAGAGTEDPFVRFDLGIVSAGEGCALQDGKTAADEYRKLLAGVSTSLEDFPSPMSFVFLTRILLKPPRYHVMRCFVEIHTGVLHRSDEADKPKHSSVALFGDTRALSGT